MKNIYLNTALTFLLIIVTSQLSFTQTTEYINPNHLLNLGVCIGQIENTQQGFIENEQLDHITERAEKLLHQATSPQQITHEINLTDSTSYRYNTIASEIENILSTQNCDNPYFTIGKDIFDLGYHIGTALYAANTECSQCLEESLIESQLIASDIAYEVGLYDAYESQELLNEVSNLLMGAFISINHDIDADSILIQNDQVGKQTLIVLGMTNDAFENLYQDCNGGTKEVSNGESLQCEITRMKSVSEDSTSKTLHVLGNAEVFLWKYRIPGGTWIYELTADSTLHINKTVDTTYEVKVQGWCNSDASFTPFATESFSVVFNYGYGCYPPTYGQLGCTGISQTYAYLHCNVYASKIEYAFHKVGSSSWGTYKTNKKKIKYYDLQPNTYYEFKCRVWCGSGWSSWSAGKRFKTNGYSCYVYKPTVSHITSYSANTHSTHGGKKKWAIKEYGGSWHYYTSYGSVKWKCKPGRTYYVKVRRICYDKWSGWSSTVTWTTPGSCQTPSYSSLSHYNVEQTTATTKVNVSASKYLWAIRPRGGSWNYFERTSHVMNWSSMSPGTTYEYKVKKYCGSGYWSHYSSVKSFTTKSAYCHAPSTGSIWYSHLTSSTVRINVSTSATKIQYAIWRSGWSDWKVFEKGQKYIDFTGLYDNRKYYYMVRVHCGSGWSSWSSSEWFITKAAGRSHQSNGENILTLDRQGPTSLWKENTIQVSEDGSPVLDSIVVTTPDAPKMIASQHNILPYPNPSTDFFRIQGLISDAEVSIIDTRGRIVMKSQVERNAAVNVTSLQSGIYQLIIQRSDSAQPIVAKISIVK